MDSGFVLADFQGGEATFWFLTPPQFICVHEVRQLRIIEYYSWTDDDDAQILRQAWLLQLLKHEEKNLLAPYTLN